MKLATRGVPDYPPTLILTKSHSHLQGIRQLWRIDALVAHQKSVAAPTVEEVRRASIRSPKPQRSVAFVGLDEDQIQKRENYKELVRCMTLPTEVSLGGVWCLWRGGGLTSAVIGVLHTQQHHFFQSRQTMLNLLERWMSLNPFERIAVPGNEDPEIISMAKAIYVAAEKWQDESSITPGTYFKGVDALAHREAKLQYKLTEQMTGLSMLIRSLVDPHYLELVESELKCNGNSYKIRFVMRQRMQNMQRSIQSLTTALRVVQASREKWMKAKEAEAAAASGRRRSIVSDDDDAIIQSLAVGDSSLADLDEIV
eukprot:Blabericola_migrator_1__335@NODE_1085_length_5492_cov_16_106544_g743_i0_p2_GENE_NODE_1085_length_5492_cov_16_106544_g743_i0NODE_1085_length_5492_cov_16_106544_g743_i0_p2_ORF_typecomplete_len312_score59_14Peripla_BP_3/PF13377_6/0_82Peripla_BP_3/PF13377_6/6_9e02_NODE_1085_length_5492_cov_16_106544_g743_i09761911